MDGSDTETVDEDRSEIIGDQNRADALGNIGIEVDEPASSKQARQNNGVYSPKPVVVNIRVKKPKADDTSIQNNGVVGFESFWSRG
jgi:hypothetical protein